MRTGFCMVRGIILTIFTQDPLQYNPKLTQVQSNWDGTWIALELEGHALGLNSNETRVSGLHSSLPRNKILSEHNQTPWCTQPLKKV